MRRRPYRARREFYARVLVAGTISFCVRCKEFWIPMFLSPFIGGSRLKNKAKLPCADWISGHTP